MIYFIKTRIGNYSAEKTENAIRKFAAKRHTSLDLKSSSTYITGEKYFLGLEGNTDLKITRFRTPFESLLPKIIVSFPKKSKFETYRIRYSILSAIIFAVLVFAVLQGIYTSIAEKKLENSMVIFTLGVLIFIGLTIIEVGLTKIKIQKAINNFSTTKTDSGT